MASTEVARQSSVTSVTRTQEPRLSAGAAAAGDACMFHLTGRGAFKTLLWRDVIEGLALWNALVRALPGLRALVLMPDHFHTEHPEDVRLRLARALSAYVRWRSHHRGCSTPGIERLPPAEALVDAQKRRRSERYIHRNPCRARLCDDPLAWPFSTHRDAVGLVVRPVVRTKADRVGFHAYVSGDPHVSVAGTLLPGGQHADLPPIDVLMAVSAVTRTPLPRLKQRGPARTLYLAAAARMASGSRQDAAALVGVHPSQITRARAPEAQLRIVRTVLGDRRFDGLTTELLPRTPAWADYIRRKKLRLLPGDF